jgi:hypothetical protein
MSRANPVTERRGAAPTSNEDRVAAASLPGTGSVLDSLDSFYPRFLLPYKDWSLVLARRLIQNRTNCAFHILDDLGSWLGSCWISHR